MVDQNRSLDLITVWTLNLIDASSRSGLSHSFCHQQRLCSLVPSIVCCNGYGNPLQGSNWDKSWPEWTTRVWLHGICESAWCQCTDQLLHSTYKDRMLNFCEQVPCVLVQVCEWLNLSESWKVFTADQRACVLEVSACFLKFVSRWFQVWASRNVDVGIEVSPASAWLTSRYCCPSYHIAFLDTLHNFSITY